MFRNADCSCVCKVWHFVFKTEMSRTQDELEEMAESGIRETKEKYAGMISSLKTLAVAFNGFPLYMMSQFISN